MREIVNKLLQVHLVCGFRLLSYAYKYTSKNSSHHSETRFFLHSFHSHLFSYIHSSTNLEKKNSYFRGIRGSSLQVFINS